jgi:GrpB-like predicted nucleotidyltransferase (UPF0157 family)
MPQKIILMESLAERIKRVTAEHVALVPHDPFWAKMFQLEKEHLQNCLPNDLIGRIEHFGSTAIPDMPAKPIVDMLVEVASLEQTRRKIVPILELQEYEYFWRPTTGDFDPPFYAWFIKRDLNNNRTHHIHMVEKDFLHWERLFFRDYLIEHPRIAEKYSALKYGLAREFPTDRIAYTEGKTEFITRVTETAKKYYGFVS